MYTLTNYLQDQSIKPMTLYFVILQNMQNLLRLFFKTMRKNAEGTTTFNRCDPSEFMVHFVTNPDFRISSIEFK